MTVPRVVNLTFHGIGDLPRDLGEGERSVCVSRETFERILDLLAGRDDVRITFDDGNVSDATTAMPALLARNRTATFFPAAGLVGKPGFLDPAQVRSLVAAGMVVGSHGMDHRSWVGLSADEARVEIVDARRRLEDLTGRAVDEAACPFGEYDRRTLARLRDAGFARVYTSDRHPARPESWLQPRFTVRRHDTPDDVARLLDRRPGALDSIARGAWLAVKQWR